MKRTETVEVPGSSTILPTVNASGPSELVSGDSYWDRAARVVQGRRGKKRLRWANSFGWQTRGGEVERRDSQLEAGGSVNLSVGWLPAEAYKHGMGKPANRILARKTGYTASQHMQIQSGPQEYEVMLPSATGGKAGIRGAMKARRKIAEKALFKAEVQAIAGKRKMHKAEVKMAKAAMLSQAGARAQGDVLLAEAKILQAKGKVDLAKANASQAASAEQTAAIVAEAKTVAQAGDMNTALEGLHGPLGMSTPMLLLSALAAGGAIYLMAKPMGRVSTGRATFRAPR